MIPNPLLLFLLREKTVKERDYRGVAIECKIVDTPPSISYTPRQLHAAFQRAGITKWSKVIQDAAIQAE